MSIEVEKQDYLTITEASKRFPGRPHISSVWRWILNGSNGIKLETVKVNGRRFKTMERIEKFIEQTTAKADGKPIPKQTKKQKEREHEKTERELKEFGL
ncbi:MAG: DUF1580 domain-containing protein [Planctomycetaceae bacterium]|nr:DUF1580 domain-containing protein [Planctomycetaceae bacterium]